MSVSSDTDGAAPFTNRVRAPAGARLVLATYNVGKLAELRQILTPFVPGLMSESVISVASLQVPEPVEDGPSLADNALLKVRTLARAMGLPAVADDSGLYADALGGTSGILSAHWSGRHGDDIANLQLLPDQLGDVADPHRGVHFTCATVLVQPASGGQAEQVMAIERSMEGRSVHAPQGGGGSGYDSIFVPVQEDEPGGRDRITAQMAPEEKHVTSHRRQTFRALAPVLAEVLAG